jgi:hypothetical protein
MSRCSSSSNSRSRRAGTVPSQPGPGVAWRCISPKRRSVALLRLPLVVASLRGPFFFTTPSSISLVHLALPTKAAFCFFPLVPGLLASSPSLSFFLSAWCLPSHPSRTSLRRTVYPLSRFSPRPRHNLSFLSPTHLSRSFLTRSSQGYISSRPSLYFATRLGSAYSF